MLPNPTRSHNPSVTGSWTNGWTIFVDLNGNQALDATDTLILKHGDLPDVDRGRAAVELPRRSATPTTSRSTAPATRAGSTARSSTGGIVLTDHTGSATNQRTLCLANFGRPRIVVGTPDTCSAG